MDNPKRSYDRSVKIARSLIRLKHSLDADREIADYLEEAKAGLAQGLIPQVEAKLLVNLDIELPS